MVFKLSYDWDITHLDGFSFNEAEDFRFYSPYFFASPCSRTHRWRVFLLWNPQTPNSYGVFVRLEDAPFSHKISIRFSMKVLTKQNQYLTQRTQSEFNEFTDSSSYGIPVAFYTSAKFQKRNLKSICVDIELVCSGPEKLESVVNSFTDIVQKNLGKLYESETLVDATIICGQSVFNAHRAVLAARSPTFKALFENNIGKISTSISTVQIAEDINPQALKLFLKAIYTGTGKTSADIPARHIADFLYLSEHYKIPDLKAFGELQIIKNVESTSAIKFLSLADKYKLQHAKEAVLKFMKGNFEAVMKSEKIC